MSLVIEGALRAEFDAVRARYPEPQAAVIPLLGLVMRRERSVGPDACAAVAAYLGLPVVKVEEAASFYTMLSPAPRGRHHIMVCQTLGCGLKGSHAVLEALVRELGIRPGQATPDGLFSLEAVQCLGACEMGAAVQVGDTLHGGMDDAKVVRLIADLRQGEAS